MIWNTIKLSLFTCNHTWQGVVSSMLIKLFTAWEKQPGSTPNIKARIPLLPFLSPLSSARAVRERRALRRLQGLAHTKFLSPLSSLSSRPSSKRTEASSSKSMMSLLPVSAVVSHASSASTPQSAMTSPTIIFPIYNWPKTTNNCSQSQRMLTGITSHWQKKTRLLTFYICYRMEKTTTQPSKGRWREPKEQTGPSTEKKERYGMYKKAENWCQGLEPTKLRAHLLTVSISKKTSLGNSNRRRSGRWRACQSRTTSRWETGRKKGKGRKK